MAGPGEVAVSHARANRQQNQENVESALRKNQLTALQGATLAFNNKAHTSKPAAPSPRGGSRSPQRPGTPRNQKGNYASPESSPERHIGSVKDTIKKFTDNHGSTDSLRVPANDAINHHSKSETPQWIAAQLAAGRSAAAKSSPAPPIPAKRVNGLDRHQSRRQNQFSAHSRQNSSATEIQDTEATKPARPVSTPNRAVEPTSNSKGGIPPSNSHVLDTNGSSRPQTPRRRGSIDGSVKMTSSNLMRPIETAVPSPGDPSKSPQHYAKPTPGAADENVLSPKLTSGVILSPSPKREVPSPLLDRKPPLPSGTNTSNSNASFSPVPTRLENSTNARAMSIRSAASRSPPRSDGPSESTLSRIRSQNHSSASLRPQNTGMSDDSMAYAIAASSLASSRAPSPTRNQPPPPPPRRARSRSLLKPHGSRTDDSRTPSPSKGLRETMRTHSKQDEEDDNPKKHGRRRIIKTHPHKHNEGDRKRWRDQISDNERKRYDGVWAANRGLWISSSGASFDSTKPSSDKVLNLVVREIWSRSRLPPSVLEQVWSLVDRQEDGILARDEFVVGMWLIDQRLKGRKLPTKVSASIWESVRQISKPNLRPPG